MMQDESSDLGASVRARAASQADADAGPRELDRAAAFIARYWLVLVVAAVGCAVASLAASFLLPRSWRADVLVAPVNGEPKCRSAR